MREILFRGKRIDNGEWVDGDLIHNDNEYFPMTLIGSLILSLDKHDNNISFDGYCLYEVDPATIGQYTGLNDKNGTKIFEGDILNLWVDDDNEYDPIKKYRAVVEFGNPNAEYNWGFQLKMIDRMSFNEDILLWVEMEDTGAFCEVIGNIHDNPELLSGRK